jgi:hypothetical protein
MSKKDQDRRVNQRHRKVLLSVHPSDLAAIDARAKTAGLSRSEFIVRMSRDGLVEISALMDALKRSSAEMARFVADNAGHCLECNTATSRRQK